MALILNIETATTNCSVALAMNGKLIAFKEEGNKDYSHSEQLHAFIQDVLKEGDIDPDQLDAVAISKGPGSYTGLRIGVSAAKGLCFALDIPLLSIPTLESLAHQISIENGLIVPMLDARRMEVYTAIYNQNYELKKDTQAKILDSYSYNSFLKDSKVYFLGNGVEKAKAIIKHDNAVFIDAKLPSAKDMIPLSYAKYRKSDIEDVAYFEPYYLKDFVAVKSKKTNF